VSHLLLVTASARTEGSATRRLADEYRATWTVAHPGGAVTERDLGADPVPHLDGPVAAATKTAPDARSAVQLGALALSDVLVDELAAADTVVIATPMYNWGVPSTLKAWIDHVVRMDRTAGNGFLAGKRVVVVVASAGRYATGERAHLDFVRPYLRHVLDVLGADDVTFIDAEATFEPGALDAGLAAVARHLGPDLRDVAAVA